MAQEKYAYGSNSGDLFADDDPLAELARIVGYEQPTPRPSAPVPRVEPAAVVAEKRPEPVFDLEDELLKEFERYDAPELDASRSIVVDEPGAGQWLRDPAPQAVEPSFGGHFAGTPTPVSSHVRPSIEQARAAIEDVFASDAKGRQDAEPSFDFDLADELELAVAANDDAMDVVSPVAERSSDPFRMPLANFQPARHQPAPIAEPVSVSRVDPEPAFVEQVEQAYDVAHFDSSEIEQIVEDIALDFTPRHERVEAVASAPAVSERYEPELPDLDVELNDEAFDLELDGLEIDLSDIVLSEVEAAEPVAVQVPEFQAPVYEAPSMQVSAQVEDVAWSGQLPASAEGDTDADMPFDASQIAEPDYGPEVVGDLDVPDMPAHTVDEERAAAPVFGTDFDAELAELMHGDRAGVAASVVKPQPVPQAAKPVAVDFDDFSMMMNEDFREVASAPLGVERPAGRVVIDPDNMDVAGPQGGRRARTWMIAAAASVAVIASATGLYAWWNTGLGGVAGSDGPPIVLADSDPIKVVPENPGGKTVPNQDKAVYDRVAGGAPQAPTQKSLISSSEEPLDVVQRTLTPENFPQVRAEDEEMLVTEDDRLQPDVAANEQDSEGAADSNVSLRKVRTMIVRPDGTLVAREVPETAPSSQSAAVLPASGGSAPQIQTATPSSAAPVAPGDATVGRADRIASGTDRAPVPSQRPAEQPVNVVGTVTGQGNVRPAANVPATQAPVQETAAATPAAASVPATSVPAGTYVVQIASLPSQADAEKSWRNMSTKFGNVIGGRGVDIKAADIPGKGTFYRVRVVAGTKADADSLCGRLKQAGGSCLVTR